MLLYLNSFFVIHIHIFDYPDPQLSGLFHIVPTSPDNRGSAVRIAVCKLILQFNRQFTTEILVVQFRQLVKG